GSATGRSHRLPGAADHAAAAKAASFYIVRMARSPRRRSQTRFGTWSGFRSEKAASTFPRTDLAEIYKAGLRPLVGTSAVSPQCETMDRARISPHCATLPPINGRTL